MFKQFPHFKNKPYWGSHFWAKGYCVDTVGVDLEMICKLVGNVVGNGFIVFHSYTDVRGSETYH